jgi:alpha-mannosidase
MCSHGHSQQQTANSSYPVSNAGAGNKWIKSLTKDRLGTFLGGHFSDVNLSSVLFTHKLDSKDHVKLEVWSAPGRSKPGFEEAMKQEFKEAKKGDSFGPSCEWLCQQRCTEHEPDLFHRGM